MPTKAERKRIRDARNKQLAAEAQKQTGPVLGGQINQGEFDKYNAAVAAYAAETEQPGYAQRHADPSVSTGHPAPFGTGDFSVARPAQYTPLTPEQPAQKSVEFASTNVPQKMQFELGSAPGVANIPGVADRYAGAYEQSLQAIDAFNKKNFPTDESGKVLTTGRRGGSAELAAYNSAARGALLRRNSQAFKLLRGGSFADSANLKKEERQARSAQAQNLLADIPVDRFNARVVGANLSVERQARGKQKRKLANIQDNLAKYIQ